MRRLTTARLSRRMKDGKEEDDRQVTPRTEQSLQRRAGGKWPRISDAATRRKPSVIRSESADASVSAPGYDEIAQEAYRRYLSAAASTAMTSTTGWRRNGSFAPAAELAGLSAPVEAGLQPGRSGPKGSSACGRPFAPTAPCHAHSGKARSRSVSSTSRSSCTPLCATRVRASACCTRKTSRR